MVVKQYLELGLDRMFDPDFYGYRPGKSAHQAIEQTRKRCWDYDWALDLDIKGFFDTIDHADRCECFGSSVRSPGFCSTLKDG